MKNIIATILISSFSLLTLNACSTIDGAGKDLQGAGQVISKGAKEVKTNKASPPKRTGSVSDY
mgnify:CR=1 FL=1